MARSVLRQRIDRDLARYLIRGERLVHPPVRQHWVSQIVPILGLIAALTFALWIDVTAPPSDGGRVASNGAWYVFLAVLAWFGWRIFNWRHDWFVATDKRFLLFEGFIRRRVSMMPLLKVTDLTFDRSVVGRVLGYGAFRLESAGQEQSLSHLNYLPHADRLYHDICTVLFGTEAVPDVRWDDQDGDDDEPWDASPPGPPRPPGGARPGPPGDVDSSNAASPRPTRTAAPQHPAFDDDHDDWRPGADRSTDLPHQAESIYRSADLTDDTDEIPIVQARRMPTRRRAGRRRRPTGELPLYVPPDWSR